MQTLANLSASRDVFKQIEINNGSKERLSVFYESYRAALTHQLSANADKMKNVLTTLGEAESLMQQSPLDQKLYDSGRMSPMGDKAPQMAISRSLSKKKSTRAFSVASTINDNVTLTVTNLKTKVLSYNDR